MISRRCDTVQPKLHMSACRSHCDVKTASGARKTKGQWIWRCCPTRKASPKSISFTWQLSKSCAMEGDEVGRTRYLGTCAVKEYPDDAIMSLVLGSPKDPKRSVSDWCDVVFAKTMLPGCRSDSAHWLAFKRWAKSLWKVAQPQLTPMSDTVGMDISKCLYSLPRSLPSNFARQSVTWI